MFTCLHGNKFPVKTLPLFRYFFSNAICKSFHSSSLWFWVFFFYFKCELNCILYTWTESGTRLAVLFFSFRCRPFVVCGRYFTSCGHRLVKSVFHISLLLLYVLELPFLYKESWCHKGINCSLNSNSQHVYWITMICSHETG